MEVSEQSESYDAAKQQQQHKTSERAGSQRQHNYTHLARVSIDIGSPLPSNHGI